MAFCYAAVQYSWSTCLPLLPPCCVTRLCYPEFDEQNIQMHLESYGLFHNSAQNTLELIQYLVARRIFAATAAAAADDDDDDDDDDDPP